MYLEGVEDDEYCDAGLENGLWRVLEVSDGDLWRGVEMWIFRREVEDGRGAAARIQGIRGCIIRGGIVGDGFEFPLVMSKDSKIKKLGGTDLQIS